MAKEIRIREADEVERIANELITAHHPHPREARIRYLFTTQRRRKCDRVRLASAAKMSALQRYLSSGTEESVVGGQDFLILVGLDEWGFLSDAGQRALVDHELAHCWQFGKLTKRGLKTWWGLRGHDVEEFTEVIARHGLWRHEVKELGDVIAVQLALPSEPEKIPALAR